MTSTKSLNSFLVLGLVVAVALFLGVASPAFADQNESPAAKFDADTGDPDEEDARLEDRARMVEYTGTNKILVSGQPAGQMVSQFIVEGTDTPMWDDWGNPSGQLAGSQIAPADGKALEFFAQTSQASEGSAAKVNYFYTWSESNGYQLLRTVVASPASGDSEL